MDLESLREEYRKKVETALRNLQLTLTDNYPAKIYMMDPEACPDYELVQQCLGKPKTFCVIDEKHKKDDAIPLSKILRWYPVEIIDASEIDEESMLNIYDGTYSQPTSICLWTILKKNNIIPRTAEIYSRMGLRTSPQAVKIAVYNLARKPENIIIAENLIDSCIKSSIEKYF